MGMALTGKDTIIIETRNLADLANGDTAVVDMPNNLAETKNGKNGNVVVAYNAQGEAGTFTLKVLRASADDKYLQSRLQDFINDPSKFTLLTGEFIKRIGDGAGNVTNDVYVMSGGVFQKIPAGKENVEGDTEQAISQYVISFGNIKRVLS